jgi:hypothetical protein
MPSRNSQGGSNLANLRYGTFVDSLLAAVPEIKRQHDELQEDIGPDILPHLTVGVVLEPFVKDLLKANPDIELVRRVFAFFEEMAQAQDIEVVNLLYVGIFESWVADPETLAHAWKYMGERTRQIASDAAHRWNCGENLPRVSHR